MTEKTIEAVEKKWILKRIPNIKWDKILFIYQFYSENGFRYRSVTDKSTEKIEYYKIKKTSSNGILNVTETFPCDLAEFEREIKLSSKFISKLRHIKHYNNFMIEVDMFTNITLTIMEIDLPNYDLPVNFPKEIESVIIKDITGDLNFNNKNLANGLN
jgi:CYTH domain-containing protein